MLRNKHTHLLFVEQTLEKCSEDQDHTPILEPGADVRVAATAHFS